MTPSALHRAAETLAKAFPAASFQPYLSTGRPLLRWVDGPSEETARAFLLSRTGGEELDWSSPQLPFELGRTVSNEFLSVGLVLYYDGTLRSPEVLAEEERLGLGVLGLSDLDVALAWAHDTDAPPVGVSLLQLRRAETAHVLAEDTDVLSYITLACWFEASWPLLCTLVPSG